MAFTTTDNPATRCDYRMETIKIDNTHTEAIVASSDPRDRPHKITCTTIATTTAVVIGLACLGVLVLIFGANYA